MKAVKELNEKIVASLPAPESGNRVYYFSKSVLQNKEAPSGFGVRVTAAGSKSFVWYHRHEGKPYLETLAAVGELSVLNAIIKCKARAEAVALGYEGKGNEKKPVEIKPVRTRRKEESGKEAPLLIGGAYGSEDHDQKLRGLLDLFLEQYVSEHHLRTADQIKDVFRRLVYPEIGKIAVDELRRSDIKKMLNGISAKSGPVMADKTLAFVRKALNWHAIDDDDFKPPIVKGMSRTKPKDRRRRRTLDDQELRDLWRALDEATDLPVSYPRFVKSLLLCATRRNESACLSSIELDGDTWKIPGARYKNKLDHLIPLSPAARALMGEKPKNCTTNSWYVFSTESNGGRPFSGFSKAKHSLDKAIAAIRKREGRDPMPRWTLHDLRRTARTYMSRAQVDPDHAELCLGHVKEALRDNYDCWDYHREKREAFEKLAGLVDRILNPESNVRQMRG